jgi:hypothetical protein
MKIKVTREIITPGGNYNRDVTLLEVDLPDDFKVYTLLQFLHDAMSEPSISIPETYPIEEGRKSS